MRVLQFSGGADSLATLFLLRQEWADLTVLWCDTGAAYPENLALAEKVAKLVPTFVTVRSDKNLWEKTNGIAVDVVPEWHSLLGKVFKESEGATYSSPLSCCSANIWVPLDRAAREMGAKEIIRGQRLEEGRKAPVRSGHVDASGIKYTFPIEEWSKGRVLDFCLQQCPDLLPGHYFHGEPTSHDCWNCIAYLDENVARIRNLPPERKQVVVARLAAYNAAICSELAPLEELTNAN